MGTKIGMVKNFSKLQKLRHNWRRANGLRVEYSPTIQYVAAQWRSQKFTVEIRWDTGEFHRKNHFHVDVQRHFLRQWTRMHVKCQSRFSKCKKIRTRTMVISWSWFWKEVAQSLQSSRRDVWRIRNPSTRDRGNPLSLDNRVLHSCQAWSRRKCLWIVVTQHIKIFCCSSRKNWKALTTSQVEQIVDAGFLNVVEIGQYFMTKDTAEFSQFHAVSCREDTLPREEEASQPKGWIQGNTKKGTVLEVATSYLHGNYGVEIRISSVNRDDSHSWVRISHGSNKFVMNLNNYEQEIPEVQLEEYALNLDAKDFASRSKSKTKPQRREPAGSSTKTIFIGENLDRCWTREIFTLRLWCIEEIDFSSSWTTCASRRRWSSLIVENQKKILRNISCIAHRWSGRKWKKSMSGGRGTRVL